MKRFDIEPDAVSAVFLSHLHWDHSSGLDMFPNAEVYVQKSELQWAIAPLPAQDAMYGWRGPDAPLPKWLQSRPRMTIVDGDFEFAPGLQFLHLPGHSPGCMGLCCDTAGGRHVIACDAVPMFENIEDNVPPGTYVDLNDAYRSLARIRAISGTVLPSHDARVLEVPIYPRDATPSGASAK
jgi:glyoxylase-like metal-dependent hydrolase (beta-lactamase superfamily II)